MIAADFITGLLMFIAILGAVIVMSLITYRDRDTDKWSNTKTTMVMVIYSILYIILLYSASWIQERMKIGIPSAWNVLPILLGFIAGLLIWHLKIKEKVKKKH